MNVVELDWVIVLRVWVPGRPKTKGSLEVVNSGRLTGRAVLRDSPASKRWRMLVADRVRREMRSGGLGPLVGPVELQLRYTLPLDEDGLIERGSGDIDKLDRNILDALTDAGVYSDDAQVVRCWSEKICMPGLGLGSGVEIVVSACA